MSISGVGPSQGGFGAQDAGQQSGDTGDLRKQIDDLKSKLAQSQGAGGSEGGGGSQGAADGLKELLEKLMEKLKSQEGQEGQGAGGEGQQPGGDSGTKISIDFQQ